jgi:putative membrane protein
MAEKRTSMADERTDLAFIRTAWAADRTLMAWVRTAISMIGFGFTIYKFFQYLREAEDVVLVRLRGPRNLGLTLIALGTVALVVAAIQHWQTIRKLRERSEVIESSMTLPVAVVVAIVGVIAFVSIVLRVGPF